MEEQRLPQELHLALGRAVRRPQVLVENWPSGVSSSSMGEGAGHPRPNPVELLFYHQSTFMPLLFFSFPSGYRASSKEEDLELTPAMSQHMDIDLGAPALL